MGESIFDKARRYIEEGRWSYDDSDPNVVMVQGSADKPYKVVYYPFSRETRCDCPAQSDRCSHGVVAYLLLAVKRGDEAGQVKEHFFES